MVLDFIEFLLVTNGTKLWYFVILWLRDVCEVSSFFFSGVVLFVGGLLLVGKVIPLVFFVQNESKCHGWEECSDITYKSVSLPSY